VVVLAGGALPLLFITLPLAATDSGLIMASCVIIKDTPALSLEKKTF
jgi:hypothetical protein